MVGELAIVAGETAVLLVGGAAYIGVMTYNGVCISVGAEREAYIHHV